MYESDNICGTEFIFRNETISTLSTVERSIQKYDARMRYSPFSKAVRRTLVRSEGLNVVNRKGLYPEAYSLFRIEAAESLLSFHQDTNMAVHQLISDECLPDSASALEAYRHIQAIDCVDHPLNRTLVMTPKKLMRIYARFDCGPCGQVSGVSLRNKNYGLSKNAFLEEPYRPPNLQQLPGLLDDFCEFISSDIITPLSQASIALFQFEAIKPFNENIDQMERLIVHFIFCRRQFLENIILPLGLFPMQHSKKVSTPLMPPASIADIDRSGALPYQERLIVYMTEIANDLLGYIIDLHSTLAALVKRWKMVLGRVDKGSAAEMLLYELAGRPILTISQAQKLIGKSFSTTSEALSRLETAGIVRKGASIRRNKTFEAPDSIRLHEAIYQHSLPQGVRVGTSLPMRQVIAPNAGAAS